MIVCLGMTLKKIAVITPAYNAADYVAECIRSVQHSVIAPNMVIEHIVIDDASTDASAERAELALVTQSTVVTGRVVQIDHQGPAGARNFALRLTDADYIFFLDADDIIFQNSLRTLFTQAERTARPWLYGDFLRVDRNLNYQMGQDYYGTEFDAPANVLTAMLLGQHFFQQNSFYQHALLEDHGFFDASVKMAEDFDLAIRLLTKGYTPLFVPGPLYAHRFHAHNYTPVSYQTDPSLHQRDIAALYRKHVAAIDPLLSDKQRQSIRHYLGKQLFVEFTS